MISFSVDCNKKWLAMNRNKVVIWLTSIWLVILCSANTWAKSGSERTGDVVQLLIPAAALGSTLYLHDSLGQKEFLRSFCAELGVVTIL
jgi:hypothetical protein